MYLLLALLLLVTPVYAQEIPLGDYYVFIDTEGGKEGEVLRMCNVSECEPNANELRLFKVVVITITSEEQYHSFVKALLDPETDAEGNPLTDGKIRANKIDIKNLDGKKEKINVVDFEGYIIPTSTKLKP